MPDSFGNPVPNPRHQIGCGFIQMMAHGHAVPSVTARSRLSAGSASHRDSWSESRLGVFGCLNRTGRQKFRLTFEDSAYGTIAEPSRAEPSRAEPSRAEPSRAEPSRAEPSRAEPSRAEPSRAEPSRAEPSRAEPSRAEPQHRIGPSDSPPESSASAGRPASPSRWPDFFATRAHVGGGLGARRLRRSLPSPAAARTPPGEGGDIVVTDCIATGHGAGLCPSAAVSATVPNFTSTPLTAALRADDTEGSPNRSRHRNVERRTRT